MIIGKIYCDICGCHRHITSLELPIDWYVIGVNKHACEACYSKWGAKKDYDNDIDPGPSD